MLSLFNVTCIYVSRAHHLALSNQLACYSLGKTTSPTSSFPQLPIVICVGLRWVEGGIWVREQVRRGMGIVIRCGNGVEEVWE